MTMTVYHVTVVNDILAGLTANTNLAQPTRT